VSGVTCVLIRRQWIDFSDLGDGLSDTQVLERAVDVSAVGDAVLEVLVHDVDIDTGTTSTIAVRVVDVALSCEQPQTDFVGEVRAQVVLDPNTAPASLHRVGLVGALGSALQLQAVGQRVGAGGNLRAQVTVQLVARRGVAPKPQLQGDLDLVDASPMLTMGDGTGTGTIRGGATGAGGALAFVGGAGSGTGNGGEVAITGGASGASGGAAGGAVKIAGGFSSPSSGGDVEIDPGGGGALGAVKIGAHQAGLLQVFGATQHYGAGTSVKHRTTSGFAGSEVEALSTAGLQLASGAGATTLASFTLNTNGRNLKVFCWVTGQGNVTQTVFRSTMMVRVFTRSGGTVTAQTLTNLQAVGTLGSAAPTLDNSGDTIRIRVTGDAGQASNWMCWYVVQLGGQPS
jgi:hypothetical protein